MQHRRAGEQRFLQPDDMGQDFVIDDDQLQRRLGDLAGGRRHRRHRVAFVQDLVLSHAVARQIGRVALAFADGNILG